MIIVADNIQPLNPVVSRAMDALDPAPIVQLAKACEAAGAKRIDINPGYLSARKTDRMAFLVEAVQQATALPLFLDSPDPKILAEGLKVCAEKPTINALTLNPERADDILSLALEHQTDLVLLFMDERSFSPPRVEGKISVAVELREKCLNAGIPHEKLIYDPVMPPLRGPEAHTHVGQAVDTLRLLHSGAIFGDGARTMIGLSNLRSGQRQAIPDRLEEICLGLAAGAGLSFVLMDVMNPQMVAAASIMSRFGL